MNDNHKFKFAMYWAASCGGCEISVLNIGDKILDVDALFDIVFWPIAADFKYKDVYHYPDGYIDLCLFNGSFERPKTRKSPNYFAKNQKYWLLLGLALLEAVYQHWLT